MKTHIIIRHDQGQLLVPISLIGLSDHNKKYIYLYDNEESTFKVTEKEWLRVWKELDEYEYNQY